MICLATGTLGRFRIQDDRFKKGLSREGRSGFRMADSRGGGEGRDGPDSGWQIQEGAEPGGTFRIPDGRFKRAALRFQIQNDRLQRGSQ
jgi:hypothetical protein